MKSEEVGPATTQYSQSIRDGGLLKLLTIWVDMTVSVMVWVWQMTEVLAGH